MTRRYECLECGTRCSVPDDLDVTEALCPLCETATMSPLRLPARRLEREERSQDGIGLVPDMTGAVGHLFRAKQEIAARGLENEKGEIVQVSKGMEFNVNELLGDPEVEIVEVGDDGNVKKLRVRPHQWPPKGEKF